MRELNILFGDNVDWKHKAFREKVSAKLKQADKEITIHHTQSLSVRYESNYTQTCKKLGAKSVETWVREEKKFDLIITDLDYELDIKMGDQQTGLDIIDYVNDSNVKWPWTKYIRGDYLMRRIWSRSPATRRKKTGMSC